MSVDGFLSLLSLAVAVFALLPRSKRLELSLNIRRTEKLLLLFSIFFILYLQFYRTFRKLELTPSLGFYKNYALSTEKFSYLVSILIALFFLIIRNRKLGTSSISRFQELTAELVSESRWAELVSILEKRIAQIYTLYAGNFWLHNLRKKVSKISKKPQYDFSLEDLLEATTHPSVPIETSKGTLLQTIKNWLAASILKALPESKPVIIKASEVIREILLSKNVVTSLTTIRPYIGVTILEYPFMERQDFLELYLRALHSDTNSILYTEIRNNLSSNISTSQYYFHDRNRLLHKLFKTSGLAENLHAWKGIGESTIVFLEKQRNKPFDDYAILQADYSNDGKYYCPIQCSIWFFDIMVREAFFQKTEWHMWLYYFNFFSDSIIKNLESSPRKEPRSNYHLLLEEIVSTLIEWIRLANHAEPNQLNATMISTRPEHENGNIPKSAILCLGSVMGKINGATSLSTDFKESLLHLSFSVYFRFLQQDNLPLYAEALARSLKAGGVYLAPEDKNAHHAELRYAFNSLDRIKYYRNGNQDIELLESELFS